MASFDHLPPGVLPFAVSRETAAELVGISETNFDTRVDEGIYPQPKQLGGRLLWDTEELKAAWKALPRHGEPTPDKPNPWDKKK